MAKEKPFRPAVPVFEAPTPEASLCLHFIQEAELTGWRAIPEYPKSRFDILLIAEDWVTTPGISPGTQIGVQAKMNFTKELMHQLRRHLTFQLKWNNPDYIVGLIPEMPVSSAAKAKLDTLALWGVGLFTAYDAFNGNGSPNTVVSANLADIKKFGRRHEFRGRIPPPPPDYPFVLPGSVGGQHWSEWKERAVGFMLAVLDKEFPLSEFRKHKVDHKIWVKRKWVLPSGNTAKGRPLYILNPKADSGRLDAVYPHEFARRKEALCAV
jgi:hypothetical protein